MYALIYGFMRLCMVLWFCVFVGLCFCAFMLSLLFFAFCCLVNEKQSTRARYESLMRGAYY